MAVRIQIRRGTAAEWAAANPVLMEGELGVELNTGKWKTGDGVRAWSDLDYVYDAGAVDALQSDLAAHKGAASPHSGHATTTALSTHAAVQASLSQLGHVNHAVLTTTLDTTWQGSEAPYTKTQTINNLLATDTPIVDVVMSGAFATDEARQEAWAGVYRITTADNAITVYATEKPAVELPIQLKVVR